MNEVDPTLLNFVNYHMVVEWYCQNDIAIQLASNTTTNFYESCK